MADTAVLGEVISKEEMSDPQPATFKQMSTKLSELMKGVTAPNPDNKLAADPAPPSPKSKADPKNLAALKADAAKAEPAKADAVAPKQEPAIPEITADPKADVPAEEIPAAIKTPKAAEEFKVIKSQRDEWKTKAEQHEVALKARDEELAKFREAAKNPALPDHIKTQIETLQKERDVLEDRLKEVALEKVPKFQTYFQKGFSEALEQAKSAAPSDQAEEVAKLVQAPPSEYRRERIKEILQTMDEFGKVELVTAVKKYDLLRAEHADAIANKDDHLRQMAVIEISQKEAKDKETASKIAAAKQTELAKAREHLRSFQPVEGDEAHNASVKEREGIVDAFFDGKLPPDQVSKLPIWAAHGMYLQKTAVPAMLEQIRRLTEQVKGLQAASPAINGTPPKSNGSAGKDVKKMSFTERFKQEAGIG